MSMVVCEMRGDVFEHETSMCEMSMFERRYSGEMRDDETTRTISRFNLFLFGLFPFPSKSRTMQSKSQIANRKI